MKRFKHIAVISCLMLMLGSIVGGCTSQHKAEPHKDETSQKAKPNKKKQVKTKTRKKSNEKEGAKAARSAMNFAQIKQGNYSSLLGQWSEMAASVNKHDSKGSVWIQENDRRLTVTKSEITNQDARIQGNTLNPNGSNEPLTLSFREKNNVLMADSSEAAIIWNLEFYPAGIAMSEDDWGPDLPQNIDSLKDRIIIRTSNNSYTQVFQKRDNNPTGSSAETTDKRANMDLSQIQTGKFDSIVDKWQNRQGKRLTVRKSQITFDDVDNFGHAATLDGLKLNIPSQNDDTGAPKMVPYFEFTAPAYDQKMTIESSTAGVISLRSNVPGAVIAISFLPRGVAGDIEELSASDLQQEKIVAVGTQNNATLVPNEMVYYRVK
ncbi:MAG TPA: DUF6287 domain-containing protein [Ligilactobacillus acidipiscis]|uniref:DUF6287 domain-containing protein n=1 Tax=Ligilactobacillus acidipiscis TaxID=89059 RepID=A0A921F9T4_9LACO|nr:DUF6287 domain-containing protein [Ligilactobacillus acidipiscis]